MKALSKALLILGEFTKGNSPLGVSEISESLDMNRSMVSKTLSTFRRSGFLKQDSATKKYSPDIKFFLLGSSYINQDEIAQLSGRVLRKLADETGYIAILSVYHDGKALEIAVSEGREFFDSRLTRGTLMPLHASAAGQVLIAFASAQHAERILSELTLTKFTEKTITDPADLQERLDMVRSQGFAVTRGESNVGLGAIGVPVFDQSDTMICALCCAFPEQALTSVDEQKVTTLLHALARSLSLSIGARVYPFGVQ